MKVKLCIATVVLMALMLPLSLVAGTATAPANAKLAAVQLAANLPLSFEPARTPGQYLARSGRFAMIVRATESSVFVPAVDSNAARTLRFAFENANPATTLEALDPLPGTTSYYVGNNPSEWRLGVQNFAKVRAKAIYPGVDVVYYGDRSKLEFDFVVAPNADPSHIAMNFSGMDKLYTQNGDLVAEANGRPVRLAKPFAYQVIDGQRKAVPVEYALAGDRAQLQIGSYDNSRELIIDPVVDYATYLGGYQKDEVDGIAIGPDGTTAYVTGQTCSPDFPGQSVSITKCAAYVSHINANGSALIGSTVVIGGSNNSWGHAIAVDSNGVAYVSGETNSTDLPTAAGVGAMVYSTANPAGKVTAYFGGDKDAFIAQVANGVLTKLAYLGGSKTDMGYGIAIDSGAGSPSGKPNVIATGESCYPTGLQNPADPTTYPDFPVYNGFQRKVELCVGFVTKLDNAMNLWLPDPVTASWGNAPGTPPTGGQFYFSEYFGGQPPRVPNSVWIANHAFSKGDVISVTFLDSGNWVSKAQKCVVAGTTGSLFPQWSSKANSLTGDGTVTWQNMGDPEGLVNATTISRAAAVDAVDDIYVAGGSDTDFIACKDCGDTSYWIGSGAWVLKVSKTGDWVYSTVLGVTKTDIANAIAVDGDGQAYIAGTSSGGLFINPSTVSFGSKAGGGQDAFVTKLDPAGTFIKYAGYLGGAGDDQGFGIAVDVSGAAYVVGSTKSKDFPMVNPLTNPTTTQPMNVLSGTEDAFIARIIPNGSAISFSSYLGGSGADQAYAVSVVKNGEFAIMGGATYSFDFPTHQSDGNAGGQLIQTTYNKGVANDAGDAFVAKIPIASLPKVAINDLQFAAQTVGTTSAAQMATFTNTGNTVITIGSISTTGDFAVTDPNSCAGKALGANASCTVSVTFTPTAAGARTGTLKFSDNAPGSPHTSNLSGTGTATTGIGISPNTSWDFGNQEQNKASSSKSFVVTNYGSGTAALTFSIGGTNASDFKITTDALTTCSTTTPLAASPATCGIAVTFTPSAQGARAATLTVTSGSTTLTVNLTGTGTAPIVPDFTVTAPSSGLTVGAGATKTLSVSVAPTHGFTQSVSVTCSVPAPATCSVTPASLTLDGSNPANATVSVTIPAASSGGGGGTRTGSLSYPLTFGTLPFCAALFFVGRRRKLWLTMLVLGILALSLMLTGCGGGGGNNGGNTNPGGGMTPGTYNLTITATYSGSTPATTHTTTVPLVVTN